MEKIAAKLICAFAVLHLLAGAVTTAYAQNVEELATRGEAVANQDPLTVELRNRQPDALARRGFDIGMAAAEGQTADGPGKQRIRDSLSRAEQVGFRDAVTFSLERNRNAKLAATGAAIAEADSTVAAARNAEADPFYKLGFDIATGIFGDPAKGAQGNTATGPGSLGIRDSLSAAGQRGFNAAVTLHLSRSSGGESVSDRGGPERVIDKGGVGKVIDKVGNGPVIDRGNSRLPNAQKRLILSAEGSSDIQPVVSGKLQLHQNTDGEIWLAISYEDGSPFMQAKPEDIRIETLSSKHGTGAQATLDRSRSSPNDGIWHFLLPQIEPGSHFYLISVVVEVKAWRTTFEGRSIVRAGYTRMPFWNAQRLDGTIWEPPK